MNAAQDKKPADDVLYNVLSFGNTTGCISLPEKCRKPDVISSVPGYNSKGDFLPQIHMIFLFSLDHHMHSYFLFEKRAIWHYKYVLEDGNLKGKNVIVFLDERLKAEEEKDYLSRIAKNNTATLDNFFENQHCIGTIAVITDLDKSGERIYNLLKSRVEIEIMFDAFKNVLNADRTYMRDDYQMEGWTFINFIALVFYYRLYRILADNSLLKRYTPNDVLIHLSRIYKLKIQNVWITSEIPKKTRDIVKGTNNWTNPV